ncbi:V-type ATP synthase subunit D [Hydrogenimonas sp.]|nr:V-type ATP synthase subunit D [Hydrogenimonas sp.]
MALKSKTALLELRADFEAASGGEEILEQKRNIILKEIMSMLDEVQNLRERADEAVEKSYRLLIKAFMESGRERVEQESRLVEFEAELNVVRKSFIGIVVPEVSVKTKSRPLPSGYAAESIYLDLARVSFTDAVKLILELSSVEIKVWRLAKELKKSIVRVNALKNYYLPRYRKEIKDIESALEESEREFLTILKILTKESEKI